uniref:Peptidase M13 C-terminal domain-containing protein n=1 Tax=Stomoxys calcitrans TaxID=35570 RepID=A0A1I8NN99_STOCA
MLTPCVIFTWLLIAAGCIATPVEEKIEMIEKSMNTDIDACEDFYKYACDNWQSNYATDDYAEMIGLLDYKMNVRLEELLKKKGKREPKGDANSALYKLKAYYRSCQRAYAEDLLKYSQTVKPGPELQWPVLQSHAQDDADIEWPSQDFDIFKVMGELHGYNIDHLLLSIASYRTAEGVLEIHFNLPNGGEEDSTEGKELLFTLPTVGFSYPISFKYMSQFNKMDSFWRETYAQYSETDNTESMTYSELQTSYPNLWKFLESMLPGKVAPQDEIFINNVDYYRFLNDYTTPQGLEAQELANYLFFKFIKYLNDEANTNCIKDTRNKMNLAANYLYSTEFYLPTSQENNELIARISGKIHRQLQQLLDENFMHLRPSQIAKLKRKLSSLKVNVGNLPENVNQQYVDAYYGDVTGLSFGNFHKNHLALLKHRGLENLAPYHNQTHNTLYYESLGYDINSNLVIVPMSCFEPPFYDASYDDALVWSLFGYLLSYEYMHTLDHEGLERDLWGFETSEFSDILGKDNFDNYRECLKAQDDSEQIPDRGAAIIGLKVAYQAFVNDSRQSSTARSYSTTFPKDKLFFMNMAQFYCGNDGNEKAYLEQILMNSEEFAKAFRCPIDSRMNPREKCRLY